MRAEELTSEKGGLSIDEETGRGMEVKKVRTAKDIKLRTQAPPGGRRPKA